MTEDADLGIRLALEGYRVADLPSSTLEEAPGTVPAWMNQRIRGMKGFVQVSIDLQMHLPGNEMNALSPPLESKRSSATPSNARGSSLGRYDSPQARVGAVRT